MTMFPVTTLDQALQSLRQAFGCDAVVQDASETFYHDVPAVSESGAPARNPHGQEADLFNDFFIPRDDSEPPVSMN